MNEALRPIISWNKSLKMKLNKLIYCEMYRDGGSLEATWTTSEDSEWTLCLKVDYKKSAFIPFEDRQFKLHM